MTKKNISKLFLPALMLALSTLFITGCNLSGSSGSDDPVYVVPPPVPANGITGIWTGTFSWDTTGQQKDYAVTMMFHTPEAEVRGRAGGVALGAGPDDTVEPHFLFEGGYQYYVDAITGDIDPDTGEPVVICEGDVWGIGRSGLQGTFIQEFSYITGSAAGPDQRGSGCLYLTDADGDGYVNELTGEISFEEAGRFNVKLTYSQDNIRDVSSDDLGVLASDADAYEAPDDVKYHLWSNDNSGNYMSYTANSIPNVGLTYLHVVENSNVAFDCNGLVVVSKVAGLNLFTLTTPDNSNVSGCSVTPPGEHLPGDDTRIAYEVDLPYSGLGAFFDLDADGKLEFIHLMASQGSGAGFTSQALYNRFIVQQ